MTLGDTLSNAQALVQTLADTVPEMEEYSVFDKRVGPQALVDAMADTLAEVEAVKPGDPQGDAHALNDLVGDTTTHRAMRRHWSTRWLTRYQRWRSS